MSGAHTSQLKLSDVDKHLQKKMLVHRRVLQHLNDAGAPANAPTAAAEPGSPTTPSSPVSPLSAQHAVNMQIRTMAVAGLARQPSASTLASLAEEPTGLTAGGTAPAAPALSPEALSAVAEGLASQFQAQRMQHLQLAAAREALVAGAEARMPQQA